jgi:hypothetical protein
VITTSFAGNGNDLEKRETSSDKLPETPTTQNKITGKKAAGGLTTFSRSRRPIVLLASICGTAWTF